jgi:hypothetical protein
MIIGSELIGCDETTVEELETDVLVELLELIELLDETDDELEDAELVTLLSLIASASAYMELAMIDPTTTAETAIDRIPTIYRIPVFVNLAIIFPPYGCY